MADSIRMLEPGWGKCDAQRMNCSCRRAHNVRILAAQQERKIWVSMDMAGQPHGTGMEHFGERNAGERQAPGHPSEKLARHERISILHDGYRGNVEFIQDIRRT
jgi:hypothetical protein